jgi:hypothetical protein
LIGERLRHCRQHRWVFLIYRVVDSAVADRSADTDALGRCDTIAGSLARPRRHDRRQSGDQEYRPKWGDYFLVLVMHGPAVAVPPETLFSIVDPLTFSPIAMPWSVHTAVGPSWGGQT